MDAATGEPVWTYRGAREWLRNSRFSADGERIIAGFGSGMLTMLTRRGAPLWTRHIGQFPMLLAIDAEYNVYAAGKNRELFSFDGEGNLRWRRRIPNHVVTAGAMSADGTLIVLGTVGDWLYAFNRSGDILWQRSGRMGHNSLDMTADGELFVDGSGGLYNRYGTSLWRPEGGELIHSTVAISDDGAFIATGDEGSVIKIFERLP
jgi:outer membrane protein assembly factor BamB